MTNTDKIDNLSYIVFDKEQCNHIRTVINEFSIKYYMNNVLDVSHETIHQKLMQLTIDKNRNVDTVHSTTPYKIIDVEGSYGLIVDNVIIIAKPHCVEWGGIIDDNDEALWSDSSFENMAHFVMTQVSSN